jgi:hypothetical protein
MKTSNLNAVYSLPGMQRRYEVWFLRLGLADGSGAWWFRYLMMNPGRRGCPNHLGGKLVQVWATWFPRGATPQSFIQGFSAAGLSMSPRGASPFHFAQGENRIAEDSCAGRIALDGHEIPWDLRYRSRLGVTLSDRGWIGFSRTPHSDAVFSGEIIFDGRSFRGEPLGYGLQGHNCGFRHRGMWTWTHSVFADAIGSNLSSFEALEYDIPLGLRFRIAILWTGEHLYTFRRFEKIQRHRETLRWSFECTNRRDGTRLEARIDGSGISHHRLPYLKTDCSGTFEVSNNSLAKAALRFRRPGQPDLELSTDGGAVIEMTGE